MLKFQQLTALQQAVVLVLAFSANFQEQKYQK
jgi:hypothetical protein